MYYTLILQLLSFIGVQGKIPQCIVGGVNESNCQVWLKGSVLEKYYISSIGKSFENDESDIPYKDFTIQHTAESLASSGSSASFGRLYFDEYLSLSTILRPYVMHTTDKSNNSIASCWQEVLKTGTDVIRLKFHSKLVLMYKKSHQFIPLERLVFLRSCYSAASIYYFANKSSDALNILKDGMDFIELIKNESIQAKNKNNKEIVVWSVLYLSFKIEVMKTISNTNIDEEIAMLLSEEKELLILIQKEVDGKYPSSYILMFRQYFLDEDFDEHKKNILYNVVKSNLILFTNKEHPDHMYVSKYNSLVSSLINPSDEQIEGLTSFMHLVDVILSPVICTEDRLLNYKAMEMVKKKIDVCINEKGWIKNINEFCNEISNKTCYIQGLQNILDSLVSEKICSNINITNHIVLKIDNVETIDEYLLHNIISTSINMNIDSNSKTFETSIKIVKKSIEVLNIHIEHLRYAIECQVEKDKSKYNNCVENQNSYIIAKNWLAELIGFLCNNVYPRSIHYCFELDKQISTLIDDDKIRDSFRESDVLPPFNIHLEFLLAKHLCKSINQLYTWENTFRPVGWNIQDNTSNIVYLKNNKNRKKCYANMIYFVKYYRFINPIEAYIYIFRSEMILNKLFNAKDTILKALNFPVVTSEENVE